MKKFVSELKPSIVAASMMILLAGCFMAHAETRQVSLPTGTVIPVTLDKTLSSKSSYHGETFYTTVQQGQYDAGLPAGTRIEGVVNETQRSRNGKPGYIGVSFKRIVLPNSQSYPINGSLYSLNGKGLTHTSSGRLVAQPNKNASQLKFIGIGAGAGLVIATLTKGNSIEEMAVGAGLGYLYNQFVNKPKAGDVMLKPGAKFGVMINKGTDVVARNVGYAPTPASYVKSNSIAPDASSRQTVAAPSGAGIGVMYGNQDIAFPNGAPFVQYGIIYVPLAPVAKTAGIQYTYNTASKSLVTKDKNIKIYVGSSVAFINGQRQRISGAPLIRQSTLYVPMDFLSILTNKPVSWDKPSQTIIIHVSGGGSTQTNGNGS